MFVVLRASVPAAALRPAIEDAVRRVDPALPISGFKTQTEQIDETIGKERVFARLLTVFGGFALVLACIGLHGVTSYSVSRRTSELGVRLALGAQRSQVLWLVLRQVVLLAIIGLAIGLPVAWMAGSTVSAFLFGVEPTDPLTIAVSALVMFGVAVAAGAIPARRASRLHAITAMRTE
jgi:ABC-type antimicrobial peptide transport system permease subunit